MTGLQSYLGSPVQVVDTGTDEHGVPVSAVVKVDIIATTDLEDYSYTPVTNPYLAPAVPVAAPVTAVPGLLAGAITQPVEVTTATYTGPNRRVAQRRSGVERRVA